MDDNEELIEIHIAGIIAQPALFASASILQEGKQTIDLTDSSLAIGFVPFLYEAKFVEIESEGGLEVRDEEHRAGVPAV